MMKHEHPAMKHEHPAMKHEHQPRVDSDELTAQLTKVLAEEPAPVEDLPDVINNHAEQIKALIIACDDHASRIDQHDEQIGVLQGRFDRLFDQFEMLVARTNQVPTQSKHPLLDLQAKLRALGPDWANTEAFDLGDGRVLLNGMTPTITTLEARIAGHKPAVRTPEPPC